MTQSSPTDQVPGGGHLGVFAVAFVGAALLYVWSTAPAAYWLDSSEWVSAVATLGIAHPPAHPLYVQSTHLLTALPLGGLSFRVNLASALAGALSCGFVALLVYGMACALRGDPQGEPDGAPLGQRGRIAAWSLRAGSVLAGLAVAASPAFWVQSARAEVYALHNAVALALALIAFAWTSGVTDRRLPCLAAWLIGLGAANHHYSVVFLLPAVFAALLSHKEGRRAIRSALAFVWLGFGIMGVATYAALPLWASRRPPLDWTAPTNWSRFWDTLSARAFRGSVTGDYVGATAEGDALAQAMSLMEHLGPISVLAALVGLAALALRRPKVGAVALLFLVANQLSTGLMDFDPTNPDAWGYLGVSYGLAGALAGGAVLAAPGLLPPSRRPIGRVLAAVVILGWLAVQLHTHTELSPLARNRATELAADAELIGLPPGGWLASDYFSSAFNLSEAQWVDGRRPDVTLFHHTLQAQLYGGAVYCAALRSTYPNWARVMADADCAQGMTPLLWARLASQVPLAWEANMDPPLENAVQTGLIVMAASANSVVPATARPDLLLEHPRLWEANSAGDRWSAAWELWQRVELAGFALRRGDGAAAEAHTARAEMLNPTGTAVRALRGLVEQRENLNAAERSRWTRSLRGASLRKVVGLPP